MPRAALGGAACFVGVALIWLWVTHLGAFPGDGWARRVSADGPPVGRDLEVVSFLGQLGTEAVAAVTVLVAAVALRSALGLRAAVVLVLAALAVPANDVLKALLGSTPPALDSAQDNFPSGHVVYATAVGGALALMALQRGQREIAAVCVLIAVAMGPARVWSGAHVVSDVAAGYLLGAGWLLLLAAAGAWRASP